MSVAEGRRAGPATATDRPGRTSGPGRGNGGGSSGGSWSGGSPTTLPRDTANVGDLRLALAAYALLITGGLGFGRVLAGLDWWFVTNLVIAIVLGTAVLLRRTRLPAALVWLGTAIAWLLTITLFFGGATALIGIIPTPATLNGFTQLRDAGFQTFHDGSAPLDTDAGVVFVMAAGGGLVALAIAWLVLGRHSPVLAGVLVVAVYAGPTVAVAFPFDPWVFALVAVSFLWLLREDVRRKELLRAVAAAQAAGGGRGASPSAVAGSGRFGGVGPAIIVSTVAVIVALLTPAILPDLAERDASAGARGSGPFVNGINPLISLGQSLRRPANTVALEYTTTADAPPYLKVTDLNEFTGSVWGPDNSGYDDDNGVNAFPAPPGLGDTIPLESFETTVTIDSLSSPWLPLPYPTQQVSGLRGDWRFEAAGLTAMARNGSTRGQTYTATSSAILPTAQQMRDVPPVADPASAQPYLELPDDLPAIIGDTAREVTATASTDYDRAIALQRFFRSTFEYSETAPVEEGFDGSGTDVIATFLERKAGYCIHFSSAMAVMARILDIPSRIAIGYLPGTTIDNTPSNRDNYIVTSDQLHAWPELYFEGVGWVPFEPTASRGVVTSFSDASTATPGSGTTLPDSRPAPAAESTPTPTAGALGGSSSTQANSALSAVLVPLVIVLGVLLLLASPAIVRGVTRSVRRRRARAAGRPAGWAWAEFLDTARDLGFAVTAADSPRGFVRRLRGQFQIDSSAIDRLLAAVERESYAEGGAGSAGGAGASRVSGVSSAGVSSAGVSSAGLSSAGAASAGASSAGAASSASTGSVTSIEVALTDAKAALRAASTRLERFVAAVAPRSLVLRGDQRVDWRPSASG
ncbi:transglutaminaseTgpA domain-containing protein [Plantibacter sp. RU18]|uniref:transglutaminase family protein n=1 Tax=Plantibacter sp. RU18 TaxID=3158143 RepID=UPI003D35BA79